MAAYKGKSNTDTNCPSPMMQSVHDDDFVVLQRMTDSTMSDNASSMAEKQAFESLEKGSNKDSVLQGSSFDDEKPFYDDNIFLDKQEWLMKKRGFFGEADGGDGSEKMKAEMSEKTDPNVENLQIPEETGSHSKVVPVLPPDGKQVVDRPSPPEQQGEAVKGKGSGDDHVEECESQVPQDHSQKKVPSDRQVAGPSKSVRHTQAEDAGKQIGFKPKNQTENNNENVGVGTGHPADVNHGLDESPLPGKCGGQEPAQEKRHGGGGTNLDRGQDEPILNEERCGTSPEERCRSGEPPHLERGRDEPPDQEERDGGGDGAPLGGREHVEPPLQNRHGNVAAPQFDRGQIEQPPQEARREGRGPPHPERRGYTRLIITGIGVLIVSLLMIPPPDNRSPKKPTIILNPVKHLPPTQTTPWKLEGLCTAYNTSYTIALCRWHQIHPLPTSPENTVLEGEHNCLPGGGAQHKINAVVTGLKVPTQRGNYIFELVCADNTEHKNAMRDDIWVNDLVPPVIEIPKDKINPTISTSVGSLRLEASCRASQGNVASQQWVFIEGDAEIYVPPEGGLVKFREPGKYQVKYKCTDSYGALASQLVSITVKPSYVLGIDLGTSTTCVVVIKEDGTSHDIPIYDKDDPHDLDPCMPSVVAFSSDDGRLLVGEKAARQAVANPASTIYEVKRLMGRSYYDDPNHTFGYRVRPTLKSHSLKGVRAAIEIPCKGTSPRLLQPELVSALILRRVVDIAEDYLGVPVRDVVISVPAQFDDAQRKATKDAGLIAGLNPIKIVNEPTVAAFASRNLIQSLLDLRDGSADMKELHKAVLAVVADIGGGTTDYALMQIQGTSYKVQTTDGNKALGGRDIDILLASELTKIFAKNYPALKNLHKNKAFQQQLRIACETAKVVLSEKTAYAVTVDYTDQENGQREPLPLTHTLKREEFESFVSGIFLDMVKPLKSLMARSGGFHRESVDELYLVGGTSNIPKLRELLRAFFPNVTKVYHKDPVQLVGRGAAAFGAVLTRLVEIPDMPRVDVTPLPISIAEDMDDMRVIFARNRIYPCIEHVRLSTFTDSQTAVMIKVYEGDGRTADECHFLGEFELSGIPPMPKHQPEIRAYFDIDKNGILSVRAEHGKTQSSMKVDIYSKSGSMTVKTRDSLRELLTELNKRLKRGGTPGQPVCSLLQPASPMGVIPPKPRAENVLKLSVDSEYESVLTTDQSKVGEDIRAMGMVTVNGFVTDYESSVKESDLDIILVVDKSESMIGRPIDTIKDVINHLIDVLKPNHRLGIVTFDYGPTNRMELTYITEVSKATAHDIVHRIDAFGATNLYGGLENGLRMAYHGGRRSRILLFTDGYANRGIYDRDSILREATKEIARLLQFTSAQVTLSTFGYKGKHDHELLSKLASNIGDGSYNFLSEESVMAEGFGHVLGDAINTVAENIQLTLTPLGGVQIVRAMTKFTTLKHEHRCDGRAKCSGTMGSISFEIPSTANQQARHVLVELAVPASRETSPHENLLHVELTYRNTITERDEGGDDYLFVERSVRVDTETPNRMVDEQLNRVHVAEAIGEALELLKVKQKYEAITLLKEAQLFVSNSISKEQTLSLCLNHDLTDIIRSLEYSDLNEATKFLQDSLSSHWHERGGKSSCYLTKKEDKLITILKN